MNINMLTHNSFGFKEKSQTDQPNVARIPKVDEYDGKVLDYSSKIHTVSIATTQLNTPKYRYSVDALLALNLKGVRIARPLRRAIFRLHLWKPQWSRTQKYFKNQKQKCMLLAAGVEPVLPHQKQSSSDHSATGPAYESTTSIIGMPISVNIYSQHVHENTRRQQNIALSRIPVLITRRKKNDGSLAQRCFPPPCLIYPPRNAFRDGKHLEVTNSKCNRSLMIGSLNSRSVCNKELLVHHFIIEHKLDVLVITESWLSADCDVNRVILGNLTPPGFKSINVARIKSRGGGILILYRESLKVKAQDIPPVASHEAALIHLSLPCKNVMLLVIYRPPGSAGEFLNAISEQLSTLTALGDYEVIVTGDFNIHVDQTNESNTIKLMQIFDMVSLKQLVSSPTHDKGHILDLFLVRENSSFTFKLKVVDGVADHSGIITEMATQVQPEKKKSITYNQYKQLDLDAFIYDLSMETLCSDNNKVMSSASWVDMYNTTISKLVSRHAPQKTRLVILKKLPKWFNPQILKERRLRRFLERKWIRTKLEVDKQALCKQRKSLHLLMVSSKETYYQQLLREHIDNPKALWAAINKDLLHRHHEDIPLHLSTNVFSEYFSKKIDDIRSDLMSQASEIDVQTDAIYSVPDQKIFQKFKSVTKTEVLKLITTSPMKQCSSDPIHTRILKACTSVLLEPITSLINSVLVDGLPNELKHALVTPVLKNGKLPRELLQNYRPISNLPFLAKLIERVISKQLLGFFDSSELFGETQSAYRINHSTETLLLRVRNDLLTAMDKKQVTAMVSLDLSAAFDTVDHQILLNRLYNVGIRDSAFEWLTQYLKNRTESVKIGNSTSSVHQVTCGVPQGSILGPILFNIYVAPIGAIVRSHGLTHHSYADDTQLYLSFDPGDSVASLNRIEVCCEDVRRWMADNMLKLNNNKTELIMCGTRQQLDKIVDRSIMVGDSRIEAACDVKSLGVLWDSSTRLDRHVQAVCKTAFMHIRHLKNIRRNLSSKCSEQIVHAFITSRVDYCNSLLYGAPDVLLKKLQGVMNAAARVVSQTGKFTHITPVLKNLHWLPVKCRIRYKLAVLAFKCIHGAAPGYLSHIVVVREPSRVLRSSKQPVTLTTPLMRTNIGQHSFLCAAPMIWNQLPSEIRNINTLNSFKSALKTHLFVNAF